jgi:hypothetical protein
MGIQIFFKEVAWDYNRFLAKALPEGVLRYRSKSRAFWRSENAIAVLIFQGLHFEV